MKAPHPDGAWTTAHELEFIASLGQHSDAIRALGHNRNTLLKGYMRAIQRREEWGDINAGDVQRRMVSMFKREVA